ncbi:TolC family protein [Bacteroidota bacterium]
MRHFIISLLVIAVFFTDSAAQDEAVWSLDDCVVYALDNNISLKRQELNTEISKKDFTQSKLNLLPDVGAGVEHTIGDGRVLDLETYRWVNSSVGQGWLGVQGNLTLFNGLQGFNRIQMSKAAYLLSKSNLVLLENNITLQVMTGYLDLLRKKDLLEIAEEKVRVTGLQVNRMERLMEVGNASSGELLEVKAQHSTEKYNLINAENSVEISRLNLVHLLNLEIDTQFDIDKPEIPDPSALDIPNLDSVYANSLRYLPQIEGAQHNITMQQKSLAVAKGALSPNIYMRGLYRSNYNNNLLNPLDPLSPYTLPDQVYDHRFKSVAVGINIPIFNKWQSNTNISKAKIELQDARYNMENEKQLLLQEIQQFYTDAVAALENYHAAGETFANSEEAYRYTEEKFKVGMATALELEEARNRLFQSQSEMISAKYVFVFYSKILDFYQGKEINLS